MVENYAPLAIFAYNRFEEFVQTISSLKKNPECSDTNLYIFIDGARNKADENSIKKIYEYCQQIIGFRELNITVRDRNIGLKANIISGVSSVIEKFGRVICLEDDIVVSSNFLNYMNSSLQKYENREDVWHINGWNVNYNFKKEQKIFCSPVMNCWGWATWERSWKHFSDSFETNIKIWDISKRYKFNLSGSNSFYSQLVGNFIGRNNTWAVFWYATIFNNAGKCITPRLSLTKNIGEKNPTHKQGMEFSNQTIYEGDFILPSKTLIDEDEVTYMKMEYFKRSSSYDLVKRFIWLLMPIWVISKFFKIRQ